MKLSAKGRYFKWSDMLSAAGVLQQLFHKQFCFLLFALLVMAGQNACAQATIGSITQRVLKAPNDKARLAIYKEVLQNNELEESDSMIKLLESGIQLFEQRHYEEGKADLQLSLGFVCSGRRLLGVADENLKAALAYFERAGNTLKIAEIHNLMGVVEARKTFYDKAIRHFLFALDIYEKGKNAAGIVSSYIKLGKANSMNGNFEKALAYYKNAIQLLGNDTLNPEYVNLNNNIGSMYGSMEQYDTAYTYFIKALRACNGPKFTHLRISSLINVGNVSKEKGNREQAAKYYEEALMLAERKNSPEDIIKIKINIGILQGLSDSKSALKTYAEALKMAQEIEDKSLQAEIMRGMVGEYSVQRKFEEALSLNERREELEDSLFNLDKAAEIASLELGYQLSKTNARLAEVKKSEERILKERNTTRIIALLLALSFLTLLFFFRKLVQLNRKLRLREEELQKANHTKDRLFSIIGHDLRNPINNILMVLDMIITKKHQLNNEDEVLGQLREDSITTLQTLDNLLKWGTSQLTGIIVNPHLFLSAKIVAAEFRQLKNIAAHKSITIINEVPEDTQVYIDPEHFKFIVRNLVFNAIKFTPGGGFIKFAVSKKDEFYLFSVTDNGMGISAEKRLTLFQQFGSSEYGTENEKGNGIGLMLCKLFIQENGGDIWVEGHPEGKGSVFFFTVKSGK